MSDLVPSGLGRRAFLGASLGGLALAASPFSVFGANAAFGRPVRGAGYGPLQPTLDETTGLPLLLLPRGFSYISYGWTGDVMSDGVPTPALHDGMAAFGPPRGATPQRRRLVSLVRNHELGTGAPSGGPVYDPGAAGGTTNLEFDFRDGQWLSATSSLTGTIRNCAGGPTSNRSWITCEETGDSIGGGRQRNHGYNFEVPATGVSNAQPLVAMGRFSHEAIAEDPATGYIYQTEDTGDSLLYRFRPRIRGNFAAGGTLEAMRVLTARNPRNFNAATGTYDLRRGQLSDDEYAVTWVPVANPDPAPGQPSCRAQGQALGGALISRGEGAWYGNGGVTFISTDGGDAGAGQVFHYDPRLNRLKLVFESPSRELLGSPDNVCVTSRGGVLLCEDGGFNPGTGTIQRLHALTPDGQISVFAQNNITFPPGSELATRYGGSDFRSREWCGATFDDRGRRWLFVNIQTPGVTFAITGPWNRSGL